MNNLFLNGRHRFKYGRTKRLIICLASTFRTDNSRRGVEIDSTCNLTLRCYFILDNIIQSTKFYKEKSIKHFNDLAPYILAVYYGLVSVYKLDPADENGSDLPNRLQIWMNSDSDFFSIVIGLKVKQSNKEGAEAGLLRLEISKNYCFLNEALPLNMVMVYCHGYKTHDELGAWDNDHIKAGPTLDFKKADCRKTFQKLVDDNYNLIKLLENVKIEAEGGNIE